MIDTQTTDSMPLSRRSFLRRGAIASAGLLLTACMDATPSTESVASTSTSALTEPLPTAAPEPTATNTAVAEAAPTLPPTPECADLDDTLDQTAGPFYTPNTPERTNLREEGMAGAPLLVTGRVLNNDCSPVAGAILDFWHADDGGRYDNAGFRLRGHQFTDAQGNYRLETIVPGLYPGRTRHIHDSTAKRQKTEFLSTDSLLRFQTVRTKNSVFAVDSFM